MCKTEEICEKINLYKFIWVFKKKIWIVFFWCFSSRKEKIYICVCVCVCVCVCEKRKKNGAEMVGLLPNCVTIQ